MTATDGGLDRFLDRTVAPGYSRIGYALRRRRWPADDPAPGSLAGKRALVTGAGGGLGEATALGLAKLGATVHLVVRSPDRAQGALDRIRAALAVHEPVDTNPPAPELHVEECDVSDLKAVQRFATGLRSRLADDGGAIDVLVHNAGVLPAERTLSPDGHELTVATHVLGPVLMTQLLLPTLRRARDGARVIFVSSGGMYTQALHVDDPDFLTGTYSGPVAYARSKRMQVELAPRLAGHWAPDNVGVYAMHPGWAETPGLASSLPLFRALTRPFLRSAAEGADTAVWLAATAETPPFGTFWCDRQQRPTSYRAATEPKAGDVDRLWDWVQSASRPGT